MTDPMTDERLKELEAVVKQHLRPELLEACREIRRLREVDTQNDILAEFILENIEGEPSRSEGAVECAIRLLGERYREHTECWIPLLEAAENIRPMGGPLQVAIARCREIVK